MKEGTILITLKTTNSDGTSKEMTFENKREAAAMLREMFGDDALATEKQHIRNQTNNAIRDAFKARELDPSAFFRHSDNGNG